MISVQDLRSLLQGGMSADPTAAQVAAFNDAARQARTLAAAGDTASARAAYDRAAGLFVSMGSPVNEQDTLDYAYGAAYGDLAPEVQQQQDQLAQAQARAAAAAAYQESPQALADRANEIGFLPAVLSYDFELDQAIPGQPAARATESLAAEMRATGVTPLVRAAAPQSGRDQSTPPPIPLPKATKAAALGALLGSGAGAALGGIVSGSSGGVLGGGALGGIVGGLLGYATGGGS